MGENKLQRGTVARDSDEAQDRCVWGVAGGKAGGVDLANRTIDGVASTIQVDRDGEIILPSAFEARLPKFLASSRPFLAAHRPRTLTAEPSQIGWVTDLRIEKFRVPATFRFVADDNGPAERWWKLASDPNGRGIMFSIGFIPVRWVTGTVADLVKAFPEIRGAVREAGLAGEDRLRVWTEIELLEISAVPVPSNPGAVQLLAAKAAAGELGPQAAEVARKEMDALAETLAAQVAAKLGERMAADVEPGVLREGPDVAGKLDELTQQVAEELGELREMVSLTASERAPHAPDAGPDPGDGAAAHDAAGTTGADPVQAAARRAQRRGRAAGTDDAPGV